MELKVVCLLLTMLLGLVAAVAVHDPEAKMLPIRVETDSKRSTNDVLRHIGMARIKSPPHHRKRLASQSRKSHTGDSHMYVIKLPHNPYYYENDVLLKDGSSSSSSNVNSINRIPVSFKSNGKPGKIYHWNLPVVKKMAARKASKEANQVFKPSIWEDGERRVSYYKPKKPSKQAFHKFFPGNGKPQSLFVIETKNKRTGGHHDQRLKN